MGSSTRRVAQSAGRILVCVLAAIVLLVLVPSVAHAWTPGTHVFLGDAVLRSLAVLPPTIAMLLREFPYDFLYGSIAADTSIAKKYAPVGRHCHSWNVGMEIFDGAPDEPLRAFALGYLAHLAADSIAHNYFVPKQLALTSSTSGFGHSYWESRFETHLGSESARRARELILIDHSRSDSLLDRVLSPTIFSTPTNRRIFRGMVIVADNEGWQRIFQLMTEKSRWDLPEAEVEQYLARSFDYIMDLLSRMDRAEPFKLDPSGDRALRLAKRIRREVLRRGGEQRLREEADAYFGMPASELRFATTLGRGLYEPIRAVNN
ncbi:MAG TPA: zinc dependent phospholipase C family protein [Gemmatimonadaceae bacterium]